MSVRLVATPNWIPVGAMDNQWVETCPFVEIEESNTVELASIRVLGANNCRIHVQRRGAGSPVCVFIHGAGEGGYVWDEFLSAPSSISAVTLDLRGHGESDWDPRGIYTEMACAADIFRVLNALGRPAFVLVGHSLGAAISMRVASEDRSVRKLVIVDYGPGMNPAALVHAKEQLRAALRVYSSVDEYREVLSAARPLASRERVEAFARRALRQRPDGRYELKCDPSLILDENDRTAPDNVLQAQLRAITCPTLIVRGSGSAVLPIASAQRMLNIVKGAELRNVPMAGHAVMLDNPNGFAECVLPFLSAP